MNNWIGPIVKFLWNVAKHGLYFLCVLNTTTYTNWTYTSLHLVLLKSSISCMLESYKHRARLLLLHEKCICSKTRHLKSFLLRFKLTWSLASAKSTTALLLAKRSSASSESSLERTVPKLKASTLSCLGRDVVTWTVVDWSVDIADDDNDISWTTVAYNISMRRRYHKQILPCVA